MSESPWFRSVVGIGDNYMGLAPARATQKPGMLGFALVVESRPLGDDRGGHWTIKRAKI